MNMFTTTGCILSAVLSVCCAFSADKTVVAPARVDTLVPVLPVTEQVRQRFDHTTNFYRKYVDLNGLLIMSSSNTSDRALREAHHLIQSVMKTCPEIHSNLVAQNVRVGVMAYTEFTTDIPEHNRLSPWMNLRARGLGGNPVTCGEENLLQFPGDRYRGENILIHEFAHILDRGLRTLDDGFRKKLRELYNASKQEGNISGYGMNNPGEFWAEGVQSWFNCNRRGGLAITHKDGNKLELNTRADLKKHMPALAVFVRDSLRSNTWSYTPVAERLDQPHLRGYDHANAPTFVTPDHIREEGEKHRPGTNQGGEARRRRRRSTE